MDDVKIAVIKAEPVTENGITYDIEIWLFDHGKQGTSRIVKRIPRTTSEEVRRKNRERAEHAVWMMYQDKLKAAM